ncbi:MAG: FprA family A-type flavoprotein [Planctomycetes bacterium]|nr:FprA family A-type flavoprotein [Planctomycetota bacterium]
MPKVLILYHSQEHGNTHAMADSVGQGAREGGAQVELVNTNEQRLDMESYRSADAVAFGSPDYYSYIAGGLKVFLDDWHIAKSANADGLEDKPYGLFYSHGGGGKVRQPMEQLFARAGRKVGQTIGARGRAGESECAACRQLGRQLAEAVK